MKIIDTHAHYDEDAFDTDRDYLLTKGLSDADVELVVNMGAAMEGSEESVRLAQQYPMVYAGCGIHPDDCGFLEELASGGTKEVCSGAGRRGEEVWDIEALLQSAGIQKLRHLLTLPKVVCVGEIGLDYHWMVQPKEIQQKWFAVQLHLAAEMDLPINVHSREASQDTFDIIARHHTTAAFCAASGSGASSSGLRTAAPSGSGASSSGLRTAAASGSGASGSGLRTAAASGPSVSGSGLRTTTGGIIHCYSGSPEMAEEYVKMGYHIGVGGVVTFKNSKKLRKVVERIPLEAIVTETDCPYMAPEPVRGSRNDSRNIRYVIEKIAEIKGIDVEECAAVLRRNASEVYRLPV